MDGKPLTEKAASLNLSFLEGNAVQAFSHNPCFSKASNFNNNKP
jgi:hypothetical protein